MSANNSLHLIGRLTKDIELRKSPTGKSVTKFTLAVYRTKDKSDFINCVAWNGTADFMQSHFRKGSLIALDGSIQRRTYDDNTGARHWITEVLVDNVAPLESKAKAQNSSQEGYSAPQTSYFTQNELDISDDDLPY